MGGLEGGERATRLDQHLARDPGELGDREAIAAARRSGLHRVQEHDAVAVFGGIEVHVDDAGQLGGERGEFEIMGGEQRESADACREVARRRSSEREAVESAGAAADFVHQHQAAGRRVVQDVGGLCHLDHEGRAAASQIITRADAGEHPIERPDLRRDGRYEAADVREDHDQGRLAHEGALAAHVGAGDHPHAGRRVECEIVRHERAVDEALDHRMAPAADAQHGAIDQFRGHPAQRRRPLGEGGQGVELGDGGSGVLQRRQHRGEPLEQRFPQHPLAGERTLARTEHLVLKTFELRCDEPLGVLDGLATQIIGRHLGRLAARQLDEEALHAVVAELQLRQAGAGAFAGFEFEQEGVRVRGDVPQFVEFGIMPGGDHAAITQQCGRLLSHCMPQQRQLHGVLAYR